MHQLCFEEQSGQSYLPLTRWTPGEGAGTRYHARHLHRRYTCPFHLSLPSAQSSAAARGSAALKFRHHRCECWLCVYVHLRCRASLDLHQTHQLLSVTICKWNKYELASSFVVYLVIAPTRTKIPFSVLSSGSKRQVTTIKLVKEPVKKS